MAVALVPPTSSSRASDAVCGAGVSRCAAPLPHQQKSSLCCCGGRSQPARQSGLAQSLDVPVPPVFLLFQYPAVSTFPFPLSPPVFSLTTRNNAAAPPPPLRGLGPLAARRQSLSALLHRPTRAAPRLVSQGGGVCAQSLRLCVRACARVCSTVCAPATPPGSPLPVKK